MTTSTNFAERLESHAIYRFGKEGMFAAGTMSLVLLGFEAMSWYPDDSPGRRLTFCFGWALLTTPLNMWLSRIAGKRRADV